MKKLTTFAEWQALEKHYTQMSKAHLRELFAEDTQRFTQLSLTACEILVDYSKNFITTKTLKLLCALAQKIKLSHAIEALFKGAPLNYTENRAALHTALRNPTNQPIYVDNQDVMPSIHQTLQKMAWFCQQVANANHLGHTNQPFTDVVNIGIGGSDLGPSMVTEALMPYIKSKLRYHFVSNIDSADLLGTLRLLKPETTLFIVSSKSFTTLETLTNANTAKHWLVSNLGSHQAIKKHFVAITNNHQHAQDFGIAPDYIFPIWEWVGGRYSIWSASGLPVALAIGIENFKFFLQGAYEMDQHFRQAPLSRNLPVILGLLGIWYSNFFSATTHAIIPYYQHLHRFPAYLQQMDMESNGKQALQDGSTANYATGPIIWGELGCNSQHAFHQLFHQGTQLIPIDFIIPAQSHYPLHNHHEILFANCLSQTQALMRGKTYTEALHELLTAGYSEQDAKSLAPHKAMPGNRPSNTIVFPKLSPYILGALIALYEHKVFVQSTIWGINSFDQWGVELGKQLAKEILPQLSEQFSNHFMSDSSTSGLIQYYRQHSLTANPLCESNMDHKKV